MQKKPQRRSAVPGRSLYEKTPKPRDTVQRLKETIHKQPAVFAVYVALRLIVLAELVMSIIRGEYESAFICLLVLALFILPFSFSRTSVSNCRRCWRSLSCCSFSQRRYWGAGVLLHHLPQLGLHAPHHHGLPLRRHRLCPYRHPEPQQPHQVPAVAGICGAGGLLLLHDRGVLWEFFEFGMDRVFHLDMQKDTVVQSITSVMLDPTNSNTPSPSTASTRWPSTARIWALTGIWISGCTIPWRICSSTSSVP